VAVAVITTAGAVAIAGLDAAVLLVAAAVAQKAVVEKLMLMYPLLILLKFKTLRRFNH
jgi:hypothetical protein